MDDLKNQLIKELQQNMDVKVHTNNLWNLEVPIVNVSFETVLRTKMDILMKMMLVTCQRSDIQTTEALSELLIVDPLFINDLMNKMMDAQMIKIERNTFKLTDYGNKQLTSGIFEHKPELLSTNLVYSPAHRSFLNGKFTSDTNEEVFRYQPKFTDADIANINQELLHDALTKEVVEKEDGHTQKNVTTITSVALKEFIKIPCLEFQLQNTAEDLFYVRVWNSFLSKWDEDLETTLSENERNVWREKYKEE